MTHSFLLEIGVEELPARFVPSAIEQLQTKTAEWFKSHSIQYSSIQTYSTPRRLAIIVNDVSEKQPTRTDKVRGPKLAIAKDEQGEWSKAAIGFAKGQGQSVDDIYIETDNNHDYIFLDKTTVGQETWTILPDIKSVISAIHFPQTMRWGNKSYRFARPIRWLVALWDEEVVPFEVAGIQTDCLSRGHRFLGDVFQIKHPENYVTDLTSQFVIPEFENRKALIKEGIQTIEIEEKIDIDMNQDLLDEVTNLVEYPTVFMGDFSETFLALPQEVLITSMREHQRYFPVFKQGTEKLLNHFIGVRNGDANYIENVIKGNEKVLRARLADGEFFYNEDKKQSIQYFNDKLERVVFQEKIGTVAEKVQRTISFTKQLSHLLSVDPTIERRAIRAAEICKFDLMTNMVNEFTELQGIMGEKYALYFKEDPIVAQAIREHYLPTSASGQVPQSFEGAIVAVADKIVTIVSCFEVGLEPTGSQDPLGLRRQANGLLRILAQFNWPISVENLLELAGNVFNLEDKTITDKLKQFLKERLTYLFTLENMELDIIQAVLANEIGNLTIQKEKILLLSTLKYEKDFKQTQEALIRVINLAKKYDTAQEKVDPSRFKTESERKLYQETKRAIIAVHQAIKANDLKAVLSQLTHLAQPVTVFFEENMVMDKDEEIKNNRLSLIHDIAALILELGDITKIEWKQHH